jgi:hypothetical protein
MKLINGNWIQTIAENLFNKEDIRHQNFWHVCGTITTINSTPLVIYTPPAGKRFYVTDIIISTANDNVIQIREGDNGCKNIFTFKVNTQGNSGTNMSHSFSLAYKSDIDTTLRITNTTNAEIRYSIQGYYK